MFGLDPLSRPVAVAEILILLVAAAFIGWLLGRLSRSGRVKALRLAIVDRKRELTDTQQAPVTFVGTRSAAKAAVQTVPDEPTMPLITTDPLAPIYGMPILTTPEPDPAPDQPDLPTTPPPVEIPPLGAPIPEAPPVFPPQPAPADNSETAVLNRIAARSGELSFDRIGRAAPTDADDLKDIVGIGPFLERKLHSLGLYTFRQISSFSKEDSRQVNEIIEFFPGRIDRDDWVGQAKALHERKYGA